MFKEAVIALSLLVVGGCSSAPGISAPEDMGTGGNGDGDAATGPLAIAPLTASLGFGQSLTFSANRPVMWSVVEAGGGVVAADGRYTAPFVPATVHVHAVTTDAPLEEATATVSIADHALTLVAGNFGGPGTADGIGAAARFQNVRAMAWDGTRYVYFGDAGAVRRLDVTTNEVATIAGRSTYWTGNVDAVGAAAKFGTVWSVALDGQGALYVADTNNQTIRKLDLKSRAVTTVAGSAGVPGLTNAAGTAARFNGPTGLAFDGAAARLYIADLNNGAIRAYDPATTQVTTLTTQLTQPDGLAYDGSGTLYVADAGTHQIWTVDVSSHAATVIAGSGRGYRDGVGLQAHFDAPSPLALEGGALYVGDTLGLRKIDLSSKQVSTVPMRGGDARIMTGLGSDGQGHLWAFAVSDGAILKVTTASGASSALAGPDGLGLGNVDGVGAAARFFDPGDLVASPAGALYVSDASNSEVRRVDLSSAMVSTVVGTPAQDDVDGVGRQARMYYPTSLASDHAGTLYVVQPNTNTIRKWVAATNTLTTLAGRHYFPGGADGVGSAARFNQPVAACVDGGALYVAEQGNHTIRKITIASGTVETIAGTAEEPGGADGVGAAARFRSPSGIACDGAGFVYVADTGNYAIRRIALASQTVDTVAGGLGAKGQVDMPGNAARFTMPTELTFANGFLYVVDNGYVNLHVRKIQPGTWNVQTIATSTAGGQEFYGIAVDGNGVVYVSNKEFANSTISTVAANGTLTPFAGSNATGNGLVIDGTGTAANFFGAAGMTFDGSALFVAEPQAMVVRRIDPATAKVTSAFGVSPQSPEVAGAGSNAFVFHPAGLALVDASTLLVADSDSVDKVALPGANLTVAAGTVGYGGGVDGVGSAASLWPRAMVHDGNGTIYFTGANTVRRYVVATGMVDTIAGKEGVDGSTDGVGSAARFYWPRGIAADGAGNLYVSDTRNDTIRKVVIATGEVSTFAGTATMFGAADGVGAAARFFFPMGIVCDGKGSLYVADSENGAIRRIEIATRAVTTYVGVLGEKGLQPGALPAHLNAPRGLALLPDGGLAVTDEQAVLVVH